MAGPGSIRYGLGAVKGVGQGAVDAIVEERARGGAFRDLADLCGRVDLRQVGRRTLEAMVKAGCFDGFGPNRATLASMLPAAMQFGEQSTRAVARGPGRPVRRPGRAGGGQCARRRSKSPRCRSGAMSQRLQGERDTLGLYLTGHPIAAYEQELRQLVAARIADLGGPRPAAGATPWGAGGRNVTVAGLVHEIRRRGARMTLVLDDRSGRIEVSMFDDVYQQHRHVIARDAILVVEGQLRFDEFIEDWRVNAKKLTPIEELREREARRLIIRWPGGAGDIRFIQRLEETLRPCTGGRCGVAVHYMGSGARATLALGDEWSVRPTRELLESLGAARRARRRARHVRPAGAIDPFILRDMALQFLDFEQPIAELEAKIEELRFLGDDSELNIAEEVEKLRARSRALTTSIFASLTPWQITQLARHPQRPYVLDYIPLVFTEFQELHGDRMYADDQAIVAGPARLDGTPVMVIGQQKGRDTKERVRRNYGMPKPEGYRKALRLMKTAERFGLPLVTLIDTPGAYPGVGSEERNQSEAIARNLFEMAELRVPIVSCVIGEGGSGGALAIGVCDRLLMLQYSVYSVISPEGCASILWKSADRRELAAEAMGITAERLSRLSLIDEVIPEPLGGAHREPLVMAQSRCGKCWCARSTKLAALPIDVLLDERQRRLRGFGVFGGT